MRVNAFKCIMLFLFVGLSAITVPAQGMLSDLMAGKLVDPEVGTFVWYTLTDSATGQEYYLRQAVVGKERVRRKDAYWLETELVPKVGFPSIYKMLLTGPAHDPKNVHRVLMREGQGAIQELEVDRTQKAAKKPDESRSAIGIEMITYPGGEIEAEHFLVTSGDVTTEIWVSDEIKPMGLVRMKTPQGELALQRFGKGGQDGSSAFPDLQSNVESADESESAKSPRRNFGGRRNRK